MIGNVGISDVVFFEIADDFNVRGLETAARSTVFGGIGDKLTLGKFINAEKMGFFVRSATNWQDENVDNAYYKSKDEESIFNFPVFTFGDEEDYTENHFENNSANNHKNESFAVNIKLVGRETPAKKEDIKKSETDKQN